MSKDLGKALQSLRKNCELTQKQIADVLHIDRSTYAYYERGTTEPDLKTIRKLAAMFNVDPAFLLPDEDGKPPIRISDITELPERSSQVKDEEDVLDLKEPTIYTLSRNEQQMLIWYRTLSPEQREQLKGFAEGMEE